jgi:hypothetical protein
MQMKISFRQFLALPTSSTLASLSDGFSEDDKIAVIKEYAKEKGYIKIKGDTVTLTNKGIREAGKPIHNWDAIDHI